MLRFPTSEHTHTHTPKPQRPHCQRFPFLPTRRGRINAMVPKNLFRQCHLLTATLRANLTSQPTVIFPESLLKKKKKKTQIPLYDKTKPPGYILYTSPQSSHPPQTHHQSTEPNLTSPLANHQPKPPSPYP
ncbi:hypothetical protein L873DRAFT_1515088 [Choiromyces venosus 120613-1]|uniref:Uncharacterized protein n=1 Tax=Choiromyces venosus 120613-1 TaxID=1336337 RepID=A0A3N4JAZ3_9PEZI|nr:hypothetical protein L873DRAFT_1515088 [Choiromyces venosus 120613-1]